jgi:hypothetical protein
MSTAIQLNFTLRTTPGVKTVHLLGSWDNYQNQLPMSQDPSKSAGGWIGTFRFQPGTLNQGSRYWYYYIMDGYHVTHDPAVTSVVEPTTQRKLNILDIPAAGSTRQPTTSSRAKRSSRRTSADVVKGRPLSTSEIKSPKPYKPGQTKGIVNYDQNSLAALEEQLSRATLDESDSDSDDDSDVSSDVPSLTSRSSNSSSPSSLSSGSTASNCTCNRYGITRAGNRIKIDCGGKRCGYEDESSCSSESEEEVYHAKATRRHGVVIRGR